MIEKTVTQDSKPTSEPSKYPTLDFSRLAKIILQDLNNPTVPKSNQSLFTKYTKENVIKYLENPSKNVKQMRQMSNFLYIASPQYRRLITYMATLHLLDYTIDPYYIKKDKVNEKTFLLTYDNVCLNIENMNIKHELLKARVISWREDVFYGYVHSANNSFYIQKLNPDYCDITGIENGCYTFSFDYSYFKGKPEAIFDQFPEEFKNNYNSIYLKDTKNKWLEVSSDKTFCIKVNEDIDYPLIPFFAVFAALYDIEDYKSLQKTKTAMGAYSLLAMTMPLDEKSDGANPYLIDPEEVTKYYNFAAGILPPEIGLLLSPTKLEKFSFEDTKNEVNRVSDSTNQFWSETGVSQLLMSSADGTGASLAKSVITDASLSWSLIVQIERNLNRFVEKYNAVDYRFKIVILPTTIFNWQEVHDSYLKSATYGLPTKLMAGAAMGISPNRFNNLLFLENTILSLSKTMIPMQSSNTMSTDSPKGGAPEKSDANKTASTEAGIAANSNNPDNRDYVSALDKVYE